MQDVTFIVLSFRAEGGREEDREEGWEGGMEGTRAKPGNQLVYNTWYACLAVE